MILPVTRAVASALLVLSVCFAGESGASSGSAIRSVFTDLDPSACRTEIDKADPNETPYLLCPGVGGYALIVRRVDAGRRSVEIVDPAGRIHPLDYQEFVTRSMSTLSDRAEWRIATRDGRQVPVALIVRVQAREDADHPEKVTRVYAAVAKIAPDAACVTARIPEGTQSSAELYSAADSARDRPCAPPQPPMIVDGAVVR